MSCPRSLTALLVLLLAASPAAAGTLQAESVLITLIEQVDVPAREAGVLTELHVTAGTRVEEGEELARIDDAAARLAVDKARRELQVARLEADNDIDIRFARKSLEVDAAELRRAQDAVAKFAKAVTEAELDTLGLKVERSTLQIEQAERKNAIARELVKLKENELAMASHAAERRRIVSPLAGIVVQVNRHRGEWIEPGEKLARVLRIDRLRAQGFVKASEIRGQLTGAPVKIIVSLPGNPQAEFDGTLVFVSPEVDPVNGQVVVWADFENRDLLLRPGLRARMLIETPDPKPVELPRRTEP